MARVRRNRRPRRPRWFRSRYVWIPALVVVVLAALYFIVPRRAVQIVSLDREHGWRINMAPPQRRIVWKPAERVATPAGDETARDSIIRPQLADHGSVLYFTLRSPERGADIYRSRMRDGEWQPAEPVAELNTESDDFGPVFQAGEQRLFFYSNRAGGYGGFDLYMSERAEDGGWGAPVNLGAHINSPAHEYDPAVTADGKRLFFASNRTEQMSRQMADEQLGKPGERWDSTLRADLGLPTFDLYVAKRPSPDEPWLPAFAVEGVNRPDTNEGSPYVSPAGMFIYFSSDRAQRDGESRNFDLYRARIDGEVAAQPQNLGRGVNTEANEIEPALSEEGFRIVFSRDVEESASEAGNRHYRLFTSLATEVEEEVFWDAANLATVGQVIKHLWWWIVLAVLLAAVIAAIIWYLRQVSLRRLPLPTFLLLALFLHLLLGAGSFFVYFGGTMVAQLRKDLEEVAIITHLSSRDMHQSHDPGPESYEKVADLEHVETVKPTEIERQVVETPNIPLTPQVPAPNVPARLMREMEREQIAPTIPKAETLISGGPQIERRRTDTQDMMLERVKVEQTEAEQTASEQSPRAVEVAMNRQRTEPDMTELPKMNRRTLNPQLELPQEQVQAERAEDAPLETQPEPLAVQLDRAAPEAAQPDAAETVKTEDVTAPAEQPSATSQPQRLTLEIDRQQPAPQTDAPKMDRRTMSADAALRVARADTSVEQITEPPVETKTDQQPTDLSRTAHATAEPAATQTPVTTEQLTAPAESTAADARPEGVAVQVERQASEAPQSDAPAMLPRRTLSDAAMRLSQTDTTVDPVAEADGAIPAATADTAVDAIARAVAASQSDANPSEAEPVQTEQLNGAVASEATDASPRGIAVNVDRTQAASGAAAEAPQLMTTEAVADAGEVRLGPSGAQADLQVAQASLAAPTGPVVEATLDTQRSGVPSAGQAIGSETVQTAAIALPEPGSGSTPTVPRGMGVNVDRQATNAASAAAAGTPLQVAMLDAPIALSAGGGAELARDDSPTPNAGPTTGSVQADLARAARTSGLPAGGATEQVATETPLAAGGPAAQAATPKGVGVTVGRQAGSNAAAAPAVGSLEVALVDRKIGLGGSAAASEKIADVLSGSGPKTDSVTANLSRTGSGRAISETGTVAIETVATEGPAVAAGGTGKSSSPRGVGVEVTRRGIVAPAPQGGALRVAAVSQRVGLSGLGEITESIAGASETPTPTTGNVAAKLSCARGPQEMAGVAAVEVETADAVGLATSGDAKADATGSKGIDVNISRRGPASDGVAPSALQVAMLGTDFGPPRLTGPAGELAPASDAVTPGSGDVTGQVARANRGLAHAGPAADAVPAEVVGTGAAASDAGPGPPSIAGVSVGIERTEDTMLALAVDTSGKFGGLHHPDNHRLEIGSLSSEANDAPPSFSPLTSLIARRPARAPTTMYAEDSIGMASMLKFRQVGEDEKRDLIEAFGGDEDTLKSLRGGLAWIAKQQQGDGRWSLHEFADKQSRGTGKVKSDTAGTALALLPMLGDGNTPTNGTYSGNVRKGIDWLVAQQKDDGDLYTGGTNNSHMYSHGMATIALCEAYGMTRDPELREPAQRAVDFIVAAQHKEGGWRYRPGEAGDTSVFGWQVMALKSAQMAELNVPPEVFQKAKQFSERTQKSRGEFGYQRGNQGSPAMTAEGLLCHQYLGASRSDQRLHEGAKYLLKHLPQKGKDTSYCWYYGNQVMYHLQGEYWEQWNDAMKDTLLGTQKEDGPMAGSWDPKDKWEESGGRLYSTSLRVLMLEVYYRHLPLYQVLEK